MEIIAGIFFLIILLLGGLWFLEIMIRNFWGITIAFLLFCYLSMAAGLTNAP